MVGASSRTGAIVMTGKILEKVKAADQISRQHDRIGSSKADSEETEL